jgi:hypothetical protein
MRRQPCRPQPSPTALAVLALLVGPPTLSAQGGGVPQGPEFPVNTYTTSAQGDPSVAADAAGNFVVVWHSSTQDGQGYGVFAQRYASTGVPLGAEFRVNTYTTSGQSDPSVAYDAIGNFVIVWSSDTQDGQSYGVFAQRYASTGVPLGGEFQVNTYTTGYQVSPSVALDSAGNFVIAWNSLGQDGSSNGVFAQRYGSSGIPQDGEFRVNTYTTGEQTAPSVAADSTGNFVIAWNSPQDGSYTGIFAQRYASTGAPLGGEFRVNTHTTNIQSSASVASDSVGNFVVVWQSLGQDGSSNSVVAQRYASSGAPQGGEFRVNTYTTNLQCCADVTLDSAGNFVVTWTSYTQDGSGNGVFAQRYTNAGAPQGGEFRVNTYTTGDQFLPSVASDSAGDFVVAWTSVIQDGNTRGVYAQRYGRVVPVELRDLTVE